MRYAWAWRGAGATTRARYSGRSSTPSTPSTPRLPGWRAAAYQWTRGVGAGALFVAALAVVLEEHLWNLGRIIAAGFALVCSVITGVPLVRALRQPERRRRLFGRPGVRSRVIWTVVFSAYVALAAVWMVCGLLQYVGVLDAAPVRSVLRWPALPLAALAAGYPALPIGRVTGRGPWRSPLLFWHLLTQAVIAGGGLLIVAAPFEFVGVDGRAFLVSVLVAAIVAHLLFAAVAYGGGRAVRGVAAVALGGVRAGRAGAYRCSVTLAAVAAVFAVAVPGWVGPIVGGLLAQPALLAYGSVAARDLSPT